MRPPPPPWFHDEMDRLAQQWQSEPPEIPTCHCDEAERNREKWNPGPEFDGPNQDGEFICCFCWRVLCVIETEDA